MRHRICTRPWYSYPVIRGEPRRPGFRRPPHAVTVMKRAIHDAGGTATDSMTIAEVRRKAALETTGTRLFSALRPTRRDAGERGIYGLVSYGVAQRRRELGIRSRWEQPRRDHSLGHARSVRARGSALPQARGSAWRSRACSPTCCRHESRRSRRLRARPALRYRGLWRATSLLDERRRSIRRSRYGGVVGASRKSR